MNPLPPAATPTDTRVPYPPLFRFQILRYFLTDTFRLATVGIALGMLLAFGINQKRMGKYELPRLQLVYLPIGAVALWLLGQIAVFWPARRAAAVPPAVATRRDRKSTRLNSSH